MGRIRWRTKQDKRDGLCERTCSGKALALPPWLRALLGLRVVWERRRAGSDGNQDHRPAPKPHCPAAAMATGGNPSPGGGRFSHGCTVRGGGPSERGAGLGIAQGSAPKKGQRQPCCCCLLHVVFVFFFAAAVQDTVSIAARLSSVKPLLGTFSPQLSPPVFSGSLQLIMDKMFSPYSTSATRPTAQCPAGQADRSTGQRPPPGQPRTLESENIMARLAGVCLGFRVSSNNARGRGSVECFCHQCNHRSDYFARVFGASPHLCTTSPACRDKIPPVPFLDFQLSVPGAN